MSDMFCYQRETIQSFVVIIAGLMTMALFVGIAIGSLFNRGNNE